MGVEVKPIHPAQDHLIAVMVVVSKGNKVRVPLPAFVRDLGPPTANGTESNPTAKESFEAGRYNPA